MATFYIPTSATSIRFYKGLNEVGQGEFSIPQTAFDASSAATAVEGDYFNVVFNDNAIFTFVWENTSKKFQGDVWEYTISGRGIIGALKKVGVWPASGKSKLNTSVNPMTFDYKGIHYEIPTTSGVKGVYIRNEVDPRSDMGNTVGEVLETMHIEATNRSAALIDVIGRGAYDATGTATWTSFAPSAFTVRVGQSYLDVVEEMANKGFCIFKQVGASLRVYRPDHVFASVDFSAYKYKVTNVQINRDLSDSANHVLVVDKEVITSYRPDPTATSTEKGLSVEMSNNPNIHNEIGKKNANAVKETIRLDTVYTPWGVNPLIDFDVGDLLTYNVGPVSITSKRILSISVVFDSNLQYLPVSLDLGDFQVNAPEQKHEKDIQEIQHRIGGGSNEATADVNYGIFPLASLIDVSFGNAYTDKPIVTATLQVDPGVTPPTGLSIVSEIVQNVTTSKYTGVKLNVQGTIPPSTTGMYVAVHAVGFS